MRLDMDCVRDILLCVEENTDFRKNCCFYDVNSYGDETRAALWGTPDQQEIQPYQAALNKKYGNDKLLYHIFYCRDADLIKIADGSSSIELYVTDLTVAGHELIGKIRDSKN